jgi:Uma2 family endonuclease
VALAGYVHAHGGLVLVAPLDIVLTDFDVVQPDLLLFTRERQHLVNPRKVTRHAPDLAIEILSPSTSANDRGRKLRLFATHRVREYWLVDPDTPAIEVYSLTGDAFVLTSRARASEALRSPLLPELELRPADLIPESPR